MSVAIITGASSGMGTEYFRQVVEQIPEVDEIWLIARRKEKLVELAESCPERTIAAISLDLTEDKSFEILEQILLERKPDVQVLINNAGCGDLGEFEYSPAEKQINMINLNVTALTKMCKLVLPYMTEESNIINVSSIASFAPTPGMSVYAATKAYVTSFSRGLDYELMDRQITVTAVCPGPMDTEFFGVAGISSESSPKFMKLPKENPQTVAKNSLAAALEGKPVYVGKYKWYNFLAKILPHSFVMRFTNV